MLAAMTSVQNGYQVYPVDLKPNCKGHLDYVCEKAANTNASLAQYLELEVLTSILLVADGVRSTTQH